MHPNFCDRIRGELARVNAILRAEQAKSTPDPRRIMALRGQKAWLTNALCGAEISGSHHRWLGAGPQARPTRRPEVGQ